MNALKRWAAAMMDAGYELDESILVAQAAIGPHVTLSSEIRDKEFNTMSNWLEEGNRL